MGESRVEDLIHEVIEVDPHGLQQVEFAVSQTALDSMAGKTIEKAVVEDTRIAVHLSDGSVYSFYGFAGERRASIRS